MTNIGNGFSYSSAQGINDATQVVGIRVSPISRDRGFFWQNGVMTDLGDLFGGSGATRAYAINNSAEVIGESLVQVIPAGGSTYPGVSHAILWHNGSMTDLGTLGGTNSFATDINDGGLIIGMSEVSGGALHPFLYTDNGPMVDLTSMAPFTGWTSISVNAINDNGQIVGGGINPSGQDHAFLLTPLPEPSSFVLGGLGLLALLGFAVRQRSRAATSNI